MKTRIAVLVVLVGLLFLSAAALAQPEKPARGPLYVVAPGQLAGGGYFLTGDTWQVTGIATAPGYRLQEAWPSQGGGCCCGYLPCILRNTP